MKKFDFLHRKDGNKETKQIIKKGTVVTMKNYTEILSRNILALRRESGLTQEGLASKLGLSFQAVSKWENGGSSPDIALLPEIADIFGVSIDRLFGRCEEKNPAEKAVTKNLPWEDDDTLVAAVFRGHTLLESYDDVSDFTFTLSGDALNVNTHCNIICQGDIGECANAGGDITCDEVKGCANAGGNIKCDEVNGSAYAGGNITCDEVNGNANADGDIKCDGDIGGNASAGSNIECTGDIGGNAKAGDSINCGGDICGSAEAGGDNAAADD